MAGANAPFMYLFTNWHGYMPHIYMHTHVQIWTHMYAHTYVQHVRVHASIYEQHTQAYLLTHVCVLIHTHTGTHTNTHVSVHTPLSLHTDTPQELLESMC